MADRAQTLNRWDDVPPAIFSAPERLKAMDTDGVDCAVLYPSVERPGGRDFRQALPTANLELACVQAYNDWLIDEWADCEPALSCRNASRRSGRWSEPWPRSSAPWPRGTKASSIRPPQWSCAPCRISTSRPTIRSGRLARSSACRCAFTPARSPKDSDAPGRQHSRPGGGRRLRRRGSLGQLGGGRGQFSAIPRPRPLSPS